MNKIIITLILLFTATFSFADGNTKDKKQSEITPTSTIKDTKSFEVSGLKACTGEFDDEDATDIYVEVSANNTEKFILLTEYLEESEVVEFK
ncbi:MAG: hypothetical protein COA58_05040 [Bacteroidetes bacterium]|nr:MAG: hypothetical protein COA58_05040 [Bacteroidota bacterium]